MTQYLSTQDVLLQAAADIRAGLIQFSMVTYGDVIECGAVGCIAGHIVARHDTEFWSVWSRLGSGRIANRAVELLGISEDQADQLFLGQWPGQPSMCRITAEQAAQACERLAAGAWRFGDRKIVGEPL